LDAVSAAPNFTRDFSHYTAYWPDLLAHCVGQPNLRFLEIGCFEGQATLWLLENVLTHPSSELWVVDPFEEWYSSRFESNLEAYADDDRLLIRAGRSQDILRNGRWPDNYFDFIYIDGCHSHDCVLADAVLAWPLAKDIVVFDDYELTRLGVDSFLSCYELEGEERFGQYVVRKT
jgi:predicted O-methyltransferase YrrM